MEKSKPFRKCRPLFRHPPRRFAGVCLSLSAFWHPFHVVPLLSSFDKRHNLSYLLNVAMQGDDHDSERSQSPPPASLSSESPQSSPWTDPREYFRLLQRNEPARRPPPRAWRPSDNNQSESVSSSARSQSRSASHAPETPSSTRIRRDPHTSQGPSCAANQLLPSESQDIDLSPRDGADANSRVNDSQLSSSSHQPHAPEDGVREMEARSY